MYVDGFGKFLVILDHFFFTLVKKIWAKKSLFWQFLKDTILAKKSNYLDRFITKFPF